MNKTTIFFGSKESSRMVLILQFIFGIICIGTAVMWALFILRGEDGNGLFWPATLFMGGFGIFQILTSVGYTTRYIIFEGSTLIIKKNSIGRKQQISASELKSINTSSSGFKLILHSGSRIVVRFGLTNSDRGALILESLMNFAEKNSINLEHTE